MSHTITSANTKQGGEEAKSNPHITSKTRDEEAEMSSMTMSGALQIPTKQTYTTNHLLTYPLLSMLSLCLLSPPHPLLFITHYLHVALMCNSCDIWKCSPREMTHIVEECNRLYTFLHYSHL